MATINGHWYSETLYGTGSNDVIKGYPTSGYGSGYDDYDGKDTLYGYGGDDIMYGGNQNDILYGGSGNDTMYGGLNPKYSGDDILYGESGNDSLYGGAGNDYVDGGTGNDWLYGQEGNDFVYGGSGNDYLSGGAGDDFVNGYQAYSYGEKDTLSGGAGKDTFGLGYNGSWSEVGYYGDGKNGYATITDFKYWEGDKVRLGGSKNDYTVKYNENMSGSGALDTTLYYKGDLIAVFQDNTSFSLNLDATF